MKNEVDLYLRLSNADEVADSLERQERDLRDWAAREGLVVRRVWSDYGRSGYKENIKREGFDSALAALRSGEVGTLAVWKLDRLSRRGAGQIGLVLDEIEKHGGRLVFLRDGLDTSTGTSARLPITVLSELARAESANTSLRVRSRKDADRRAGRYLGGTPPFGYELDADRKFRPADPEAKIVREIIDRVLDGDSLLVIARDLNRREIATTRGGLWRTSTLSAMLRSPHLVGLIADGREPYRDPDTGETVSLMAEGYEPLASESEQARLLAVMDSRLRAYGRGMRAVKQPKSLLGGLLYCASCEKPAHTFGNSYRCRKNFVDGGNCPAPVSVSVSVIDDAVRRAWANHLATFNDDPTHPALTKVAERWLKRFDPAPLEERSRVVSEIAETKARLDRADDDHYVRGTLDEERHERVTKALRERLTRLHTQLAELPEPEADLAALLDPELSLPALEASSVHEARELLRLAIERVYVTPAPKRGARFNPAERIRIRWVDETS